VKKVFNPSYLCLLVAVAVVVIGYRPPERGPSVEIQNASGEVQLQNSKNGSAIFQTAGLAPGRNVTGTVRLSNSGSGPGALSLSQADLVDNPGAGLGLLSSVLQLSITDVTNPGSPVNVFAGTPAALGNRSLGSMAPGQSRTYFFTASLPVGGTNAVSGSAMSTRYVWTLTGKGSTTGGGSNGRPGGAGGAAGAGGGAVVSKMPVSVKVNVKSALKQGVIAVTVKCGQACKLTAYAAAKGKPAVRTRRRSGRVKKAGKKATIKLKLSKAGKKALAKRLTKKKSLPLTVIVKAQDPGGAWKSVKKTAKVKRAKKH
jgi:spore coat-associated protein N